MRSASPLLHARPGRSGCRDWRAARGSKGRGSMRSWPASILERSSTSSRIASSEAPAPRMRPTMSRCAARAARARGPGRAEHRVHRRADLVAHVGEELALGGVGRGSRRPRPRAGAPPSRCARRCPRRCRGSAVRPPRPPAPARRPGSPTPACRPAQVALVEAVAGDAPGVEAAELAQALGDVIRMSERDRVDADQLADAAADDRGEARVGLGDPAACAGRAAPRPAAPARRSPESAPRRSAGLTGPGALALLAVAPPHQVAARDTPA